MPLLGLLGPLVLCQVCKLQSQVPRTLAPLEGPPCSLVPVSTGLPALSSQLPCSLFHVGKAEKGKDVKTPSVQGDESGSQVRGPRLASLCMFQARSVDLLSPHMCLLCCLVINKSQIPLGQMHKILAL
jgi:hypothetical protein